MSTPNQSSLQAGLSLSKTGVSRKEMKSSFLSRTMMELRVLCNSELKHGEKSSYSVKIFGAIFEEEEEATY
ncbi:hypothetical protein NC652_012148 [Populus alba x Populus x berolinensis]|nr:hypothetical protein NC652_012148 [Populus alba x Populus x berolinensis]